MADLYGQLPYGVGGYKGVASSTITATPTSGQVPLTVSFTSSLGASEGVTGYLWDFGDGNTSSSQNPTHTYTVIGTYTVSITYYYGVTPVSGSVELLIKVFDQGYVIHHTNKCFVFGLKGILDDSTE